MESVKIKNLFLLERTDTVHVPAVECTRNRKRMYFNGECIAERATVSFKMSPSGLTCRFAFVSSLKLTSLTSPHGP